MTILGLDTIFFNEGNKRFLEKLLIPQWVTNVPDKLRLSHSARKQEKARSESLLVSDPG